MKIEIKWTNEVKGTGDANAIQEIQSPNTLK